ncbi:pE-PGRS family protein [Mycobacterium kansasii 824]|nr:pE-PGRS family protein [Mycobacterium kansasii 824]
MLAPPLPPLPYSKPRAHRVDPARRRPITNERTPHQRARRGVDRIEHQLLHIDRFGTAICVCCGHQRPHKLLFKGRSPDAEHLVSLPVAGKQRGHGHRHLVGSSWRHRRGRPRHGRIRSINRRSHPGQDRRCLYHPHRLGHHKRHRTPPFDGHHAGIRRPEYDSRYSPGVPHFVARVRIDRAANGDICLCPRAAQDD